MKDIFAIIGCYVVCTKAWVLYKRHVRERMMTVIEESMVSRV